jgi:hypothetical protein
LEEDFNEWKLDWYVLEMKAINGFQVRSKAVLNVVAEDGWLYSIQTLTVLLRLSNELCLASG